MPSPRTAGSSPLNGVETTRMVRGQADLGEAAGFRDTDGQHRRVKHEDFRVRREAASDRYVPGSGKHAVLIMTRRNRLDVRSCFRVVLAPSAYMTVTQSYKFIRGDRRCRTEAGGLAKLTRPTTSCGFGHGVSGICCRFIQSHISDYGDGGEGG